MTETIKIAIVQALGGHLTCCGPNDFREKEHEDAMSAAISWHLEAGHLPAATYWADVELPPVPTIPELRARAAAGEFPKSIIADFDADLTTESAA